MSTVYVHMRVGDQPEQVIGDIEADTFDQFRGGLIGLLRGAADYIESDEWGSTVERDCE